jgi:YfiR/HmsC-like
MLVTGSACKAQSMQAPDREAQLRAAYLLNFIKFVEWPSGVSTDFTTICFAGGDGVREAISTSTAGKPTGIRTFAVRAIGPGESVAGCHLLYVDAAQRGASERLAGVNSLPILTVSDARDFIHDGGVVELFTEGNHLRFNIGLGNARRAGLRISSSLLQLASHVEESGR